MGSTNIQPAIEDNSFDEEEKLSHILYEYETILDQHGLYPDFTTDAVYILLDNVMFEKSLESYISVSASALAGLAASETGGILRKRMGDELFDTLLKMLERMVHFCCFIKGSERCLLDLNNLRWGHLDTTNIPTEVIKDLRIEYEHKLNNLKEDIISKRDWAYTDHLRE